MALWKKLWYSRACLALASLSLWRISNSLYSSSRITTPANVSTSMATRMSKFQHDFPSSPGELQALGGGAAVCRGTSILRLGLMMDCARTSSEFGSTSWGGICRGVPLVTRRPDCITAVPFLMQRGKAVTRELFFHLSDTQVSLKKQLGYVHWF